MDRATHGTRHKRELDVSNSTAVVSSNGGAGLRSRRSLIPRISQADLLTLVVSLPTIACLALGAHDVAITRLGIPFPYQGITPWWYGVVNNVVRIGALVVLYDLSSCYFRDRSAVHSMFAFGILMVFLYETLRAISVDLAVVEGWVDNRWIYMVLDRFPGGNVVVPGRGGRGCDIALLRKGTSDRAFTCDHSLRPACCCYSFAWTEAFRCRHRPSLGGSHVDEAVMG
jgi:hypothetical protein